MKTLAPFPGAPGAFLAARADATRADSARAEASAPAPAGTHWSWWLFLLGVLACSLLGPACAIS
ncbi:hypothetical protein [Hymenobacter nivis]|uniref:hypothetical protein n=1 Tax=Hymenobacter nivis TaxID=1850093 RepID=UPI0013A53AE3|nr:hypothetical protein [Hymenobacter nivis]